VSADFDGVLRIPVEKSLNFVDSNDDKITKNFAFDVIKLRSIFTKIR
jgi:hypothetical protein